ncbi:MAG: hypothetical protein N2445_06740 [Acidobacteria bacterium]|nr:hypothetical protein [Acidobacteriota bacterium]
MSMEEKDLVLLGGRYSTMRLLEQGAFSVSLGRAYLEELKNYFPKERVDELEDILSRIRNSYDKQSEAKDLMKTGNIPVEEAIDKGKEWIYKIVSFADNAFDEDEEIRDLFHLSGKVGRSVPKVLKRIEDLLLLCEKYRDSLQEWGFSDADLKKGKEIYEEILKRNTEQENSVKNLPKATYDLYLLKGKAYLLIKKLSRAGKVVFYSDSSTRAKFDLDILYRKGKKKEEVKQNQ